MIIRQTINGKVFKCDKCNTIHIEFKNLFFNFKGEDYMEFASYLDTLDGEEWEEKNKNTVMTRKIIIPIGNANVQILLNNDELNELKLLFKDQIIQEGYKETLNLGNLKFVNNLN